jgi:hypothetical protein
MANVAICEKLFIRRSRAWLPCAAQTYPRNLPVRLLFVSQAGTRTSISSAGQQILLLLKGSSNLYNILWEVSQLGYMNTEALITDPYRVAIISLHWLS